MAVGDRYSIEEAGELALRAARFGPECSRSILQTKNPKVLNKVRISPASKAIIWGIGVVLAAYVVLPFLAGTTSMFLAAIFAIIWRGNEFFRSSGLEKYAFNLEGFSGELTLLIASGTLALVLWSRRDGLHIFNRARWCRDLLLGIGVGIVSFFGIKMLLLPWLFSAMPVGSEWARREYNPIGSYNSVSMNSIAGHFFLSSFYSPFVETIIFVGFLYATFRAKWGVVPSLMLAAAIFALVHQNPVLFLDFFLIGSINFALCELRKSLAPSLFHHLTYNVMVFGSQLLSFQGLSS